MKIIQFFLIFLISSGAFAEIREIKSMSEIGPWITRDSVVVFDLDNTVMEPLQTIGSDQFFGYLKQGAQNHGMPEDQAVKWAIREVTPIQPVVRARPVENMTPKIIAAIQSRQIPALGLTARPPNWAPGTLRQLTGIGVDFSRSAPLAGQDRVGPQGLYTKGIIFMSLGNQKGPVLLAFVKSMMPQIKRVIFVDDRLPNVTNVDGAFKGAPVSNINFRYGAVDPIVKAFDPRVAETEWKCFRSARKIISDRDARKILAGLETCESLGLAASY